MLSTRVRDWVRQSDERTRRGVHIVVGGPLDSELPSLSLFCTFRLFHCFAHRSRCRVAQVVTENYKEGVNWCRTEQSCSYKKTRDGRSVKRSRARRTSRTRSRGDKDGTNRRCSGGAGSSCDGVIWLQVVDGWRIMG